MTARLFDRIARIEGQNKDGSTIVIENLRIAFGIRKNRTSTANVAIINVYNLSENSRNRLKQTNAELAVYAGYSQDTGLNLLYKGSAQTILHEREPPDIVTAIEAYDAVEKLRETKANLSYGYGTPVTTVLRKIADLYGLPIKVITPITAGFPRGFAHSGFLRKALDDIARQFQLEWSVQDGQLQIIPIKGIVDTVPVAITTTNGLINTPERINYQKGELNAVAEVIQPSWRIQTLLNPRLLPGSLVEVTSQTVTGRFIVDNIVHNGDTRGPNWTTTIEVLNV